MAARLIYVRKQKKSDEASDDDSDVSIQGN